MAGNNVIWQPQEVEDLLLYFKEKMQASGKALVLREVHHEECARRINQKYGTNFTWKQVYYKYHKLKGEWKVILEAKSASGASFDDVQKMIIYDEIEVVRMKTKGDKRAKFYNVPIPLYDDMEFVLTGKHATGEFAPFDHPPRHDEDNIISNGRSNQEQVDVDTDPSQHYDSDTLPGSDSPTSVGPKRKSEDKEKKGNDRHMGECRLVTPLAMKGLAARCLQAPGAAWGMDAPPAAEKAHLLSTEDEQREYASQPPVLSGEKSYGQLMFNGGKKRRQAGQRNPIIVDKMCHRFPSPACGAPLLIVPCAGLYNRYDMRPVGCQCTPLEEDEERTQKQGDNNDDEQGGRCPPVKSCSEATPPEEIYEALRAMIPPLDRTDLLRSYSILIRDDRRFRSLMALPKDMRKDWLLMELGDQ
ncbi:hypothetical protein U9M48_037384 [Paspalum notatum var. saurae]|uniref:Myb/SANT-like domain-containing protein n=1 Tax=Paspalum notatum var. saurae TaxID=547442 RepID=A0AAQ3XAK4_PASNO